MYTCVLNQTSFLTNFCGVICKCQLLFANMWQYRQLHIVSVGTFCLTIKKRNLNGQKGPGVGNGGIAVILQQKSVTVLTSTKVCHCFLCNFLDYTQFKVVY